MQQTIKCSVVSMVLLVSVSGCYDLLYPASAIQIDNSSGHSITEVYIALQTDSTWGANRLTTELIDGQSIQYENVDKDEIKVKIVFEDNMTEDLQLDLRETEMIVLSIKKREPVDWIINPDL